jgi:uncharacterized coiled-coil DUF342 family protein
MVMDFVVMENGKRRKQMKKAGIDKLLKAHADVGAITPGETETPEEANEVVNMLEELRRMIRKYEGKPHNRDCDYELRAEIKELKKQIEIRTQEIVTYRAFAMLVMDMKKYGRLIDKEKAFDYIMEQCSKNFNGSGEVK